MVLLAKKAVQTYLYCVPFASTMNKFGMKASCDCYCVPFANTRDWCGMTASEC